MFAPPDDFAHHVRDAAARPDVRAAVGRLYERVQSAIDGRKPRCDISGRCCRFEQFGHRLFVTTVEMAAFLHDLDARGRPGTSAWDGAGCPFQANKLCGVHAFRPFGCRMFFCDATATDWQNDAYERFHADLKTLHASLGVSYAYVEWRAALRAVGVTQLS